MKILALTAAVILVLLGLDALKSMHMHMMSTIWHLDGKSAILMGYAYLISAFCVVLSYVFPKTTNKYVWLRFINHLAILLAAILFFIAIFMQVYGLLPNIEYLKSKFI